MKNHRNEIYLIISIVIASHKFLHRSICGKCGHATRGENYVVRSARDASDRTSERVTARYLIDLGAENPAAAFPIDRRECNRRTEFPGHPVESLAVNRRRSNGNRHAVIGGSRSFRVQTSYWVCLKMRIHYFVCLMLDNVQHCLYK